MNMLENLNIKNAQITKELRLAREFSWLKYEFQNIHTLDDVELYNTERYAQLYLNVHFT